MQVHVDHTGSHKQSKFKQGMIHHMEHGSPYCQNVFLSKQPLHADSYQYESDLRNGGAGKCSLNIHGKDCQHRTNQHSQYSQHQHGCSPSCIVQKNFTTDYQYAENSGLCQDTGQ